MQEHNTIPRSEWYATYCPEDDKIRLYCGRVERELYQRLRDHRFNSTPKQSCDFVAYWTPGRESLVLELCENRPIEDEDQDPADRAADRAERFAGYHEKRTSEALGLAESYRDGPEAFTHKNPRTAEKAASKHGRLKENSLTQWSKAEYWERRTEGVIANALYKLRPEVRRRRIVKLQTELRRRNDSPRWQEHLNLRIAYEKQMLEAYGGLASTIDMKLGGFVGNQQIFRINKSPATGDIVSVSVLQGKHLIPLNIQDCGESVYRDPTPEELEIYKKTKRERTASIKAANATKPKLFNPTPEDAQKLQDLFNANAKKPAEIAEITQARYSALSKGGYSPCSTVYITERGLEERISAYGPVQKNGRTRVFKVRVASSSDWDKPNRVVVLKDKPQKALPWDLMEQVRATMPQPEDYLDRLIEIYDTRHIFHRDKDQEQLILDAVYLGWLDSTQGGKWTQAIRDPMNKALEAAGRKVRIDGT